MKKKVFSIDATQFRSRKEAHLHMKEVFSDYEYYGNNLDALHDVLTSVRRDAEIDVCGLEFSRLYIGEYADSIKRVFLDSAEENSHLTFVFSEPATAENDDGTTPENR